MPSLVILPVGVGGCDGVPVGVGRMKEGRKRKKKKRQKKKNEKEVKKRKKD